VALRRVTRSELFVDHAWELFPMGGSPDGRPSFELFELGPLRGVEELFSRAFENQPEAAPGIRFAMTAPVPGFAPLVFYAAMGTDGAVEMLDVTYETSTETVSTTIQSAEAPAVPNETAPDPSQPGNGVLPAVAVRLSLWPSPAVASRPTSTWALEAPVRLRCGRLAAVPQRCHSGRRKAVTSGRTRSRRNAG
jgi:hypothetical protein